ncbi:hypothetical protein IJ22_18110 [Paenibacillus naphthalenovorans]|uniref:Uncharacterized protein n=2 Tax=Paenibacillus naphthalenovorans TaxID=162209 RepID=A0A0U2U741_9BACL|nr:hypothetical protein IJ22_18110 [Paenibacillus naphthalenovorans]
MPKELYEEVKSDISEHVGVYAEGSYSIKKAKKVELGVDEQILKDSMIRSLARDVEKLFRSENQSYVDRMNHRIRELEKDRDNWRDKYQRLMNIGYEKYGSGWYRE